jgi:hypothetical protein
MPDDLPFRPRAEKGLGHEAMDFTRPRFPARITQMDIQVRPVGIPAVVELRRQDIRR